MPNQRWLVDVVYGEHYESAPGSQGSVVLDNIETATYKVCAANQLLAARTAFKYATSDKFTPIRFCNVWPADSDWKVQETTSAAREPQSFEPIISADNILTARRVRYLEQV